jgi:formylglycine-generating enzyme required for sulfatase activity
MKVLKLPFPGLPFAIVSMVVLLGFASNAMGAFDSSRDPGDWNNIDWFGPVYTPTEPNGTPWLYHVGMGWLYIPTGQEPGSLWMWDQEFGWIWTSYVNYPFLYHNNSQSWLYYGGIQQSSRIFYDFNSQSWINHPDQNSTKDFKVLTDLKMIWVEPGTFNMGSPASEPDRWDDETQHQVTLTKGYWLAKYELTQAQWKAVMGTDPSYFKGDNLPVEMVSWEDAKAFCEKLQEQESAAGSVPAGYAYQLPTEAQWEYACRAGTTTATAFGNSLSSTQANFDGNYPYNGGATGPYLDKTANVGSYAANAWGFHDMHGNVLEWCADWYGDYPTGSVTDPAGAGTGSGRVHRGGGCFGYGMYCRSASRTGLYPASRFDSLGFRPSLRAIVPDTTAPVVTLEGNAITVVGLGYTYLEPGYSASDDVDGDLTSKVVVSGIVNVQVAGSYTLAYNATDAAGNTGTVQRVVKVVEGNTSGEDFTVLADLQMIWVEPGTFTMGSPESEPGRGSDETQHEVTLTKGYWLAKHELTQAQWKAVMGTAPSYFEGDNLPVEQVSWEDAKAFCDKLQEQESAAGRVPAGYAYQLPTEAQWEYACRAGTTTATAYGDWISSSQANFDNYFLDTDPITNVGSYAANAWGFHDMHGNVWEWCADWHGTYPSNPVTDPDGSLWGTHRVNRGGGWFSNGEDCRSAVRYPDTPDYTYFDTGFRPSLRSE